MNNHRKTGRILFGLAAGCAALLAVTAAGAQGSGRCVSAQVDARVILPDGTASDVAQVRVCEQRYSPALGLHDVYLDGRPAGRFLSRTTTVEAGDADRGTILVFGKTDAGLRWLGYAENDGDRSRVFEFRGGRRAPEPIVKVDWNLALGDGRADETDDGIVFVAALNRTARVAR